MERREVMKKIFTALIAIVFLVSTGVSYAANWQIITTITGSSSQITSDISIPTTQWLFTWNYTPSSVNVDSSGFSIFVYHKGETEFLDSIRKTGGTETSGTAFEHQGLGDYYLRIVADNIDSYTIRIEYDSADVSEPPNNTPTIAPTQTPASTNSLTFPIDIAYAIAAVIIALIIAVVVIVLKKNSKQIAVQQYKLNSLENLSISSSGKKIAYYPLAKGVNVAVFCGNIHHAAITI
jgi:hypothetical protein